MLRVSDVLSIIAVAISLGSLGVALYAVLRDRPRLKVTSQFFDESEYGPASIRVTMINIGRRPVILRMVGGYDSQGHWAATYVENEKGGHRLGEHERYERSLEKFDTLSIMPDGEEFLYERLWIEDSLGNRHPVPNSAAFIKRLWGKA